MSKIELSEMEERVLNFFRGEYPKDFTIQEVAENLKIHRNTASTHINFLERIEKLVLSRTVGRMNFYTINIEVVKPLSDDQSRKTDDAK